MTKYLDVHIENKETIDNMTDRELAEYCTWLGEDVTEIEKSMNYSAKVLEKRGTTVEKTFEKLERETKNDKT